MVHKPPSKLATAWGSRRSGRGLARKDEGSRERSLDVHFENGRLADMGGDERSDGVALAEGMGSRVRRNDVQDFLQSWF